MSQRQRAKTQGQSLMVAWQDMPWKHIHRHVFRLQKRIYRATENAGARALSPAGYACQASGHRGAECTETGTLRSGAAVGGAIRLPTVTCDPLGEKGANHMLLGSRMPEEAKVRGNVLERLRSSRYPDR